MQIYNHNSISSIEESAVSAYPRQPQPGATPLEAHVGFFDMNADGYVTPEEVGQGFMDLGAWGPEWMWTGIARNAILPAQAELINDRAEALGIPNFEPATAEKIPIQHIGLGKHDSDTDSYVDDSGAFDQKAFELAFEAMDKNSSGALDISEIVLGAVGRKESAQGLSGSLGEFGLMWLLASDVQESRGPFLPSRSAVSKELLSDTLQGRGFYEIAEKVWREKNRGAYQGS